VQQPQPPKPAAPQADRYAQAVDAVRAGCKPSTREIQKALGCSPATAGALLKRLAAAGVIRAAGRGYEAA
jgi:DNA-binding Lrp family transcriptional regulator